MGKLDFYIYVWTQKMCVVFRRSLNLVETLLRLSDSGHYQPVFEAFKLPMSKCPDVLVLALLQTSVSAAHLSILSVSVFVCLSLLLWLLLAVCLCTVEPARS